MREFFPWIVAKDRLTAKLATFAPSGAAAGLIVRDDRNAGDFWRNGEPRCCGRLRSPRRLPTNSQRSRLARTA